MPVRPSMLRATALVAVAALALHELRYLIGYGGRSPEALAAQGHDYLPFVAALAGAVLLVAGAQLAALLLRACGGGRADEHVPSLKSTWLWASVALLAIYAGQESLEGLVSSGHPAGLAAVSANAGLVAVPLAAALGGLVAIGLRTAGLAVAAAGRRARPAPRRARPRSRRPRFQPPRPLAGVIALNLAGRAPPAHR